RAAAWRRRPERLYAGGGRGVNEGGRRRVPGGAPPSVGREGLLLVDAGGAVAELGARGHLGRLGGGGRGGIGELGGTRHGGGAEGTGGDEGEDDAALHGDLL